MLYDLKQRFLRCTGMLAFMLLSDGRFLIRPLSAQHSSKQLGLKADLRINAEDENLSSIRIVAIGPDGSLAVSQSQDGNVRLFSASGARLETIGHKGEGPGEFKEISNLGWTGKDIWVYDGRLKRLTIFSHAGKLLNTSPVASISVEKNPKYIDLNFLQLTDNGSALFRAVEPARNGVSPSWFALGSLQGKISRTISRLPDDPCLVRFPSGAVAIPQCQQTQTAVSSKGNHLVFLEVGSPEAGTYRLTQLDGSGKVIYRKEYSAPVRRLSRQQRDSIMKELTNRFPRGAAALKAAGIGVSDVRPMIRSLFAGDEGVAWIRMAKDGENHGPSEWRGYDSSGNQKGSIRLSQDSWLAAANTKYLIAIEVDQDGLESIVRYRLP